MPGVLHASDFDEDHPIPDLDVVDVTVVKKSGGSDLYIVVASPLPGDSRSLERMSKKLENYLVFIHTAFHRNQGGDPSPDNTTIFARMHFESSSEAFELLERKRDWVRKNDATLVVERFDPRAEIN